jgi:hypothetical protein
VLITILGFVFVGMTRGVIWWVWRRALVVGKRRKGHESPEQGEEEGGDLEEEDGLGWHRESAVRICE